MRNIKFYIITLLLFFSVVSQDFIVSAQSNQVTVTNDFLNVRSGPGLSYDIIDKLDRDQQLEILSSSEDWLQIQYDDRTGWVASWLTSYADEAAPIEHTEIISQTDALNFRSNPSIDAPILTRMSAGERATLLSRNGEWLHVQLNEKKGWVYAQYTSEIINKKENKPTQQDTTDKKVQVEQKKQPETMPTRDTVTYETFTVAVDTLNVRSNASQSSKKIETIAKNETYPIQQISGNWVQIKINDKKEGWVYSFHGNLSGTSKKNQNNEQKTATKEVTILSDGTNIREADSTSSMIVTRADAGEQFAIVAEHGDWYEIALTKDQTAFIANWVVSITDQTAKKKKNAKRVPGTLNGLTIVLDPGHGGDDKGTTGARGTFEKTLTLKTTELLASKLKAAGATVHLTRETDRYITLQDRVATSLQNEADAFISLHYDANPDASITGFTTYYQHPNQAQLARTINSGLESTMPLKSRGAQPADYYVLRENKENAVLIELGFLSNVAEEQTINSNHFRDQATYGIYTGILDYFNSN